MPEHLIAVRDVLNQQKGDKSPDEWKPPRQEFWCEYATAWLAIKKRWQLTLTADEAGANAALAPFKKVGLQPRPPHHHRNPLEPLTGRCQTPIPREVVR